MAETLTREKWGRKESADWWSAGQAARQETLGAVTEMMLDLAGVQRGSRVLDVAAGTGESTLMAARRASPMGHVLAVDASASMLSVAAEAAQREGLTNIKTRVMNAEDLTIESDSFDAAISRIALMLFPNPVKALTEMRRVVRPGGKVSVIVFSTLEKNPYHGFLYETVRRLGNVSLPAKDDPWMYALGETGALEDVYRRADFLNISVQAVPIQRGRQSAADAVSNMRKGAGDAKELMNRLEDGVREQAWAEIAEQFRRYEGPSGCEIPGEVLIGVGTK